MHAAGEPDLGRIIQSCCFWHWIDSAVLRQTTLFLYPLHFPIVVLLRPCYCWVSVCRSRLVGTAFERLFFYRIHSIANIRKATLWLLCAQIAYDNEMGSLTASGAGRRGSSRRGSRSSEYQQQNHNNKDANSQIGASGSPYVSVAVRVLESGSGRIFGFREVCSTGRDIFHWISAAVERHCPPRWTPWILAVGSVIVGSLLTILWVLMDVVWIYSELCSLTVPFFALMSGYLLLALGFRHSWTPTGIYLTFCGSIVGETVGFFLSSALEVQVVIEKLVSFSVYPPLFLLEMRQVPFPWIIWAWHLVEYLIRV